MGIRSMLSKIAEMRFSQTIIVGIYFRFNSFYYRDANPNPLR
jgi:hypothetical protein